jgi:excisionase family DNA binding protein
MHIHGQSDALSDDAPLVMSPNSAMRMLNCGRTRLYELIEANELESYLDGRSRKITVASIREYVARRLAASKKAA